MNHNILSRLIAAAFFSLVLLTTNSAAQTIHGYVFDAETGDELMGASILQNATNNGVATNIEGFFELQLMSEYESLITISYIGFKDKVIRIVNISDTLQIYLDPDLGEEDLIMIDDSGMFLRTVFVEATRVDDSQPFTFTNITNEELEERNLGQDVPYLLSTTPSVVTTSDAGAGIGYTGIRIRGVDPARINVTINGIPVNDAESHGVFWVDMPDIASSIENIQVQRGVGTSTNGAGAFGASINLQTSTNRTDAFAEVNTGIGTFNTRKANLILGSGLLDNGWMFEGRLSKIMSDGFIDRASADLNSFYLGASKRGERSFLKADVFSGKEITYQAWYGVEESVLESGNRTFNEAGTEKPGSPYQNQVDNYRQDYYQLHYYYDITSNWTASASLHYTKGEGYYEEYKGAEELTDYNINPMPADSGVSDLIRRRWLANDFYGGVFSTKITSYQWDLTVGGGLNQYDGAHFGEVIWAQYAGDSQPGDRYYDNNGYKLDGNLYAKFNYKFMNNVNMYVDLQSRMINYTFLGLTNTNANGLQQVEVTDKLTFFNPKAGVVYQPNYGERMFLSFGVASKEPTRDEYVNSTESSRPSPETLYNIEAGYSKAFHHFFVGASLYGMFYKDQLLLTGQINDVGAYIRENVPESYRTGIELEAGVELTPELSWAMNATFSRNKIAEISEFIDDYDNGGQIERTFTDTDIAFSPNVIANSMFDFKQNGFTTELITKYVSKQFLDNTQDDARAIDAYMVNDLRLSYTLSNIDLFESLTATLLVNNLLNATYETNGYTYGYVWGGEQRVNYYYPQAGRNFLFQLKWEF